MGKRGLMKEDGLGKERLAELQDWYRKCCEEDYVAGRDLCATLDDEIIDEEEIEKDINGLVLSIKGDLRDEYCRACREFADKWYSTTQVLPGVQLPYGEFNHLSSIRELKAASIAGCRLCGLLFQNVKYGLGPGSLGPYPNRVLLLYKFEKRLKLLGVSTNLIVFAYAFTTVKLGYSNIKISELKNILGPWVRCVEPCLENFSPSFRISRRLDENSLDIVKQWLLGCAQEHPLCTTSASIKLPTRLLFLSSQNVISGQNSYQNHIVQLVETKNWGHSVRYAALSHAWGKIDFLKLTTERFEAFKASIPVDDLTKTFQDAIHVTRSLGLQYIWIDSLCIIQDSKADWEIEAGRMASVYGGSYINIAASQAKNGNEGLFFEPSNFVGGASISSSSSNGPRYTVVVDSTFNGATAARFLTSRAWAFQERILSTRTIHFSSEDLFWECRTTNAYESFPNGISEKMRWLSRNAWLKWREPLQKSWPYIIKEYSRCDLTYNSDRLVALSGVASAAQQETGDEYFAGLWRLEMEFLLCWECFPIIPYPELPQNGFYRAPTWSWASVDCGVEYSENMESLNKRGELELLSIALNVTTAPAGPDPFGQLKGGVLTLGCSRIFLTKTFPSIYTKYDTRFYANNKGTQMVRNYDEYNDNAKLVPIITQRAGRYSHICGLVLYPTGAKKGEFERIGIFGNFDNWGPEDAGLINTAMKKSGQDTARECCAEIRIDPESGEEQYVITII